MSVEMSEKVRRLSAVKANMARIFVEVSRCIKKRYDENAILTYRHYVSSTVHGIALEFAGQNVYVYLSATGMDDFDNDRDFVHILSGIDVQVVSLSNGRETVIGTWSAKRSVRDVMAVVSAGIQLALAPKMLELASISEELSLDLDQDPGVRHLIQPQVHR